MRIAIIEALDATAVIVPALGSELSPALRMTQYHHKGGPSEGLGRIIRVLWIMSTSKICAV
jgi:hypothetical protein